MLLIGWSLLEGIGAALILPAIVALVASNFTRDERPRSYGLVASAGGDRDRRRPDRRRPVHDLPVLALVFAGEVLVVLVILALARRMEDGAAPSGRAPGPGRDGAVSARPRPDRLRGPALRDMWGFVQGEARRARMARPVAGRLADVRGCAVVLWRSSSWENRVIARGGEPLIDLGSIRNPVLRGGLTSFFFQFFIQGGMFFAVPLFLSVALGLSAIETGVRLLPLSVMLIIAAAGIPKFFPDASPRRVVRHRVPRPVRRPGGAGRAPWTPGPGRRSSTWPLLLAGIGVGALASQLGSVTVSSVSDEHSDEVGGLQNTITNLGVSVGTALTGAIVIAALTHLVPDGRAAERRRAGSPSNQPRAPSSPAARRSSPTRELKAGLEEAHVPPGATDAIVEENEKARLDGLRTALSVLALFTLVALMFSGWIPTEQPSGAPAGATPGRGPSPLRLPRPSPAPGRAEPARRVGRERPRFPTISETTVTR